ncbi:MAG: hypothetical protein IPP20_20955 [Gemmatimonadetes bacterium]|nr:hypothetical protein [Gemmatimonadota bacterium]
MANTSTPPPTSALPYAPLFESVRCAQLAVGWCAWALVSSGLMVVFGSAAADHVLVLFMVELWLAWRSYRVSGHPYYLALCALPAIPLVALALPLRLRGDTLHVTAHVLPPLVALGAVALLASGRALATRRWQRLAVVAVLGVTGWGAYQAWRVFSAPVLDTPEGRAQVAGCYRVHRGPALLHWTNESWPPSAARLDTARWVEPEEPQFPTRRDTRSPVGGPYWGEAMITSPEGTPGWWRANSRSLRVLWSHKGQYGFAGDFRLAGTDLVGSGRWFQNVHGGEPFPSRLLAVRLSRIDCAAMR